MELCHCLGMQQRRSVVAAEELGAAVKTRGSLDEGPYAGMRSPSVPSAGERMVRPSRVDGLTTMLGTRGGSAGLSVPTAMTTSNIMWSGERCP